ncbi:MAG: hypothetical protein K2K02_08025 [Ruminococcus sp.]|nr:hypothetical protein [Ruminococcus sp.]
MNCFHGNNECIIVITTLSTVKKGWGRGLMDKNELKDDIKNVLDDLKDDYTTYSERYEEWLEINNNKTELPKNLMMTELWHYSKHSEMKRTSPKKYFSKTELEKMGIPTKSRNAGNGNADGYALFKILFPHIAGFVIGCAVARFMTSGFIGYIIMGVIFAFLVGVHKSTYDDQITLKYAVIKNIVLILIEVAVIMIFAGIYGIIYMMN